MGTASLRVNEIVKKALHEAIVQEYLYLSRNGISSGAAEGGGRCRQQLVINNQKGGLSIGGAFLARLLLKLIRERSMCIKIYQATLNRKLEINHKRSEYSDLVSC